jgi:hypothetical protein
MVLNYGFAGNGVMEETVAQFLTELDPALFVIDCLPNMNADTVNSRTVPLVKYLRQKHPTTPILLTAGTTYGNHWFDPASNDDKREALKTQCVPTTNSRIRLHTAHRFSLSSLLTL